ncbi:MAG: hypothetical protein Q9169_006203 [Polycauliona sp. 2 TL-2023]
MIHHIKPLVHTPNFYYQSKSFQPLRSRTIDYRIQLASTALKTTFRFLTMSQVKEIHKVHIGTTAPGRDTLLGSALDAPMNVKHYEGEKDVVKLASILATRIIKNHAFMDGNKRTALIAANTFMKPNGLMLHEEPLDPKDPEVKAPLEAAHSDVAVNRLDEAGLAETYGRVVQVSIANEETKMIQEKAIEY